MTQKFQTNLVGKTLRISLGQELSREELLSQKKRDASYAGWRHIGEAGECVGAYLDKENEPVVLLTIVGLDSQAITVEVYAKHTRPA